MSNLTARDLNSALWAAADEMRRVMSADVYKDYLLGLVFYKALSDKMLVEAYDLLNDEKPESLDAALGWGAKFGPEGSSIIGSPSGNPE